MGTAVDVIRASDQAFNDHDIEGTARACVETFTYTDHASGVTYKGVEEFKAFLASWFRAFPDTTIDEGEYHATGDVLVHQSVERATNRGPLGVLPATGLSMSIPFCEVWRLDPEGRILAGDLYYDQLSLLVQLGHLQAPGAVRPAPCEESVLRAVPADTAEAIAPLGRRPFQSCPT
jgi:steroid delta-isomerase-like uncharacterized protein